MKKYFKLFVLLTGFSLYATSPTPVSEDEVAIRQAIHQYVDSWNHHAGVGFAKNFSDDADFVNIFGMAFSGKQAIEERHIEILQTFLKGSTFKVTDIKIRQACPDCAIVQVCWEVDGFRKPGSQTPEMIHGIFTHTFVKKDDWQITATQNTLAKPPQEDAT